MRVATLSFGLLIFALVALLQGASAQYREPNCGSNNCVPAEHCETQAQSGSCSKSGKVCCSLVKAEYRTLCRHWGGECMNHCNSRLTESAKDCPSNEVCCVLV